MSSQRRINSSRANGRLSRGPVTEDGKSRSSLNSVRHGMLATTVVLEGESTHRFTALLESLELEYQPATPTEYALIETMAVSRWMQMRVWGFAKGQFDLEMARQDPAVGPRPLRAASAFRAVVESSPAFDKAQRYATAYANQFDRALTRLQKLQLTATTAVPLPEVTGNLATSTWDADPSPTVPPEFPNEPNPISEQQTKSEK